MKTDPLPKSSPSKTTVQQSERRTMKPGGPDRHSVIAALALMVVACAVYGDSLQAPFLFDDDMAIVSNPYIKRLWPISDFFKGEPSSPLVVMKKPLPSSLTTQRRTTTSDTSGDAWETMRYGACEYR